jgi:hypothetical protein
MTTLVEEMAMSAEELMIKALGHLLSPEWSEKDRKLFFFNYTNALEAARREENEACAKVADEWNARWCVGKETDPCPSEAIRARLTQRN